jgi:hypothetical protein
MNISRLRATKRTSTATMNVTAIRLSAREPVVPKYVRSEPPATMSMASPNRNGSMRSATVERITKRVVTKASSLYGRTCPKRRAAMRLS